MTSKKSNNPEASPQKQLLQYARLHQQVALLVAGGVLLGVGAIRSEAPWWSTVLTALGTSVIVAGVVSQTWHWIGRTREREDMQSDIRVALRQELSKAPPGNSGVVSATIEHLSGDDVTAFLRDARTVHLAMLFDPTWSERLDELQRFLERDSSNRLFLYLPNVENDCGWEALAQRHGMLTGAAGKDRRFPDRVQRLATDFDDRFAAGEFARQYKRLTVDMPGLAYTGYLFDPAVTGRNGKPQGGDEGRRTAILRIYRQQMKAGEPLMTLTLRNGTYWESMRDDFLRLLTTAEQ